MLTWQLNMGQAASEAGSAPVITGGNMPLGMSLSDGLWLTCLVLGLLIHL